ncbi:ABC transporter permease [Mesorhizobium sp. BAC0120]|uniref:ABC transporter permease n=1 Tax=Mesorhizobium sp. BAC0120 TaxID=3090670 RepID=UPI00298C1947|nr:ABC transporter permease [Mesorhizobium sp. BAC0120]MDW6021134.1 ABC transporter permease [Mesorhizobium sp. BAC0120]
MSERANSANRAIERLKRSALGAYVLLLSGFLVAPIVAITLGSLTAGNYVSFPPQGLSLKWYAAIFSQPAYLQALLLSLVIACISATVAIMLGVLVALALHRFPTRLNILLQAFVLTPVMLPSIFVGLAFLIAYTRMGFGGTAFGLFAAHVVVATPFAVSLLLVGVAGVNPVLEMAARSLGASPWRARRLITLPLIAWSMAAGWGFSFMMSFGSLEISLFLNTPKAVTLPVAIYTALEWSPLDPMLTAISSGLVIVTLIVLLLLVRTVKIDQIMKRSGS